MAYLEYNTEQEAKDRNAFEAFKRGCVAPTKYWWNMIEQGGKYYLCICDEDELIKEDKPIEDLPNEG